MRFIKVFLAVAIIPLVLIGTDLAFDKRFVPLSVLRSHPLFAIVIYVPTVLFLFLSLAQLIRHRLWPAIAFTFGLIGTGLFHQWVAAGSYGNPGYMVPIGHLAAPLVSLAAYLSSFLAIWLIVKLFASRPGNHQAENPNDTHRAPNDDISA